MNVCLPIAFLLAASASYARSDAGPWVEVSDSAVVAWIPILGVGREWQLFGESWCENTIVVRFEDIHSAPLEVVACTHSKDKYFGDFAGMVERTSVSLHRVDPIARAFTVVSKRGRAEPSQNGIRIELTNKSWIDAVIGARSDSVLLRVSLGQSDDRGNRWTRQVPVTYRVNALVSERLQERYQTLEEAFERQRQWSFPPRQVRDVWICLLTDTGPRMFRANGSNVNDKDILDALGPRFTPLFEKNEITSFALLGRAIYYSDVSLFELNLDDGFQRILYQGANAHYGRYYSELAMSPTGHFLTIGYEDGSEGGFLYDLNRHRAVWELGSTSHAWSADGTTLWDSGRYLQVQPSLAWIDSIRWGVRSDIYEGAVDSGELFWFSYGALFKRSIADRSAASTKLGKIPMEKSPADFAEILGFVEEEVFVYAVGTVFAFDRSGKRREIATGENVRSASLQYIFDKR